MVDANRQPLKGTVEIDATSIGGEQLGLRGGRQLAGRKALMVAVAVEVRSRGSGRVRAEVISDASAATLSHFIVANIEQGSTVLPDGHSGHQGREDVAAHAHCAISTLKAWLLGTHRGDGADQLPVYLDEFVFRWNRRRAPMAGFQALLGLGMHREPTTYEEILGVPSVPGVARSTGRKTGLTRERFLPSGTAEESVATPDVPVRERSGG
jgi:transposase-like protein